MTSDPFARLSDGAPSVMPDIDAIKGRARRIERRQRVMVGASAASVAAVALIAVLLNVNMPSRQVDRDLASRPLETTAVQDAAPEAAADSAAGTAPTSESKRTGKEGTDSATAGSSVAAPAPAEDPTTIYAAPEALEAKVTAKGRTLGGGDFKLSICNTGKEAVTRDFNNGQRYEFEVRSGKDVIWTWSHDQNFIQTTGTETWKPGDCKTWTATWNGRTNDDKPTAGGDYTVVGTLTEANAPVSSEPVTFCSGVC